MQLVRERERIVAAARRLAGDGRVTGTAGNVSERAGDLVAVDAHRWSARQPDARAGGGRRPGRGAGRRGPASRRPSSGLHLGVYRRYGAGAVVHTHPPYATAVACVLDELPVVHYQMLALGGAVRVARYETSGSHGSAAWRRPAAPRARSSSIDQRETRVRGVRRSTSSTPPAAATRSRPASCAGSRSERRGPATRLGSAVPRRRSVAPRASAPTTATFDLAAADALINHCEQGGLEDERRAGTGSHGERFVAGTLATGAAAAWPAAAEAAKRRSATGQARQAQAHARGQRVTHQADVVVVGAGFAGLTAARAGRRRGPLGDGARGPRPGRRPGLEPRPRRGPACPSAARRSSDPPRTTSSRWRAPSGSGTFADLRHRRRPVRQQRR